MTDPSFSDLSALETRIRSRSSDVPADFRTRALDAVARELYRRPKSTACEARNWKWWWGGAAAVVLVLLNLSMITESATAFMPQRSATPDRLATRIQVLQLLEAKSALP